LGPYIWTIARNRLNDRLRQFKRAQQNAAVVDYVDKEGNGMVETLPAVGDFVKEFEFVELFRKAMDGLDPDQRALLLLVCSEGIPPIFDDNAGANRQMRRTSGSPVRGKRCASNWKRWDIVYRKAKANHATPAIGACGWPGRK
jgi:hypothetical protein